MTTTAARTATRYPNQHDWTTAWEVAVMGMTEFSGTRRAAERLRNHPTIESSPIFETDGKWQTAHTVLNPSARARLAAWLVSQSLTLPPEVADAWERLDHADAVLAALDLTRLESDVRRAVLARASAGETVSARSAAGALADAVADATTRALRHDLTA